MNHIYKVIWNTVTQTWVAVSELSRAKGKTKSSKTLSAVVLAAVSAGAIVGDAEAAALTGEGNGIAIQSQQNSSNGAFARADNVTSTAIGYLVVAESDHALAIGSQTQAIGEKTVAIGHLSKATGSESTALGVKAEAKGNGDIALGKHAVAQGGANGVTGSAALGDEAKATGAQSAAVGGKSNASGSHAVASGYNTQATGSSSSAIGDAAEASGNQSTAVGVSSEAKGDQSAALGMQAHAHGSGSIAAGVASQATQEGTTAIGGWTEATAQKATAVGNSAHANANRATALGHDSQATGAYSTATGVSSKALGEASSAFGESSEARGKKSIATGSHASASGENAIASGANATATKNGATAVGANTEASGDKATALGDLAKAKNNRATALGHDAQATGEFSTATGVSSRASGSASVATGKNATASGNNAIATGNASNAAGADSIASGRQASATGAGAIATGAEASASGNAAAYGNKANATGGWSSAFGNESKATATDASAFGNSANVSTQNGTAIGSHSTVTAINGTALGNRAEVTSAGGVALGQGSKTTNKDGTARQGLNKDSYQIVRKSNDQKSEDYKKFEDGGFSYSDKDTPDKVYAPVKLVDAPGALEAIKDTIRGSTGPVSIGNQGTTRQLINVAPGSADSDAVNVAQLKAVAGAIKHYDVVSPNGDITVTHPDPHDPNKTVWNLNLNPDRVKEITKWKLRDVEENGNPKAGQTDASVKGDETVTFQDTDTIDVERVGTDGKTLKFHTKKNIKYFSVNSNGGGNENNNGATATDAIAIGKDASSTGSNAVSLGFGAKALGANNTAIGAGAQAKDVRTTAVGYNATAEAASAVGIGYEAHATQSRSLAIGQDATASANNAIALGSSGQQSGNDRPNKTTASAEHAVAIGSGAVANIANGIALGSQSKTTAASGQTGFDASQDADGARVNKYTNLTSNNQNVRTSTLAGLSIGDAAKTRQINHLAAGTADDDAVNVAQLKSVNLAFKGDNNTKGDVRLHDQRLSVVGAQNSFITTKASDNKLEIGTKTGTIAVTEATGAVTPITTATGLVTDKTVADAIAKSGFQLKENGTLKNVVNPGESLNFKPGQGTTVSVGENGDVQVNANVASLTGGDNVTVKDNGNGSFTINAKDTNTQASVSKAENSPITINATGADNAKNYELDVAVDGTTIVKEGGKLKANLPDVSTTDLTVNEGKVTTPTADNGKKLVNATTVANAVNNSYWKATRGESNTSNDDKAEGDATSNIKAGDELTFVAGKNMALKKAGNTFTYGTKDNVSFTTVTSNGVTVNDGGSLTVGTGSTINMGNNIVGGVKTGVADTDAVNVAQLKANAATVVAGKNVSVDVAENASTGKTFTVHSEKTTVSKEDSSPIKLTSTSNTSEHTTDYKVGLNIDEGTLEVKDGKLAAKAQAKAIEIVESKDGDDNIAQVNVKSGKNKGDAGATYQVSVTKNDVKDAAKEAVDVKGSDFITVTPKDGEHLKTHTVAAKTGEITVTEATGAVTPITTATGLVTDKTVADAIAKSGFQLKENGTLKNVVNPGESLNFKPGQGTTVSVGENGDVQVNANVASLTGGDNVTVKDNGNGSFTINAKDTNTQASVSKAENSPITIDSSATNSAGAKDYKLDVNVDNTTISKAGGTLHAVTGTIEEVTTTTTGNNAKKKGQVQAKSGDDNKVTTVGNVANMINSAKWFAKADNKGGEIADNEKTNDADDADGQAMSAGDKLTLKAGKNLRVKREGANFTFATDNDVIFNKVTSGEVAINNGGKLTVGAGSTINMGNNVVGGVATGVADTDAVNVAQLKSTERHITPTTYTYNDTDKSVTLTYTDGNGNVVANTKAKIDLSGLASKIKDYSFKTNATGSNLVGTVIDTTVASGKSVNFAASDNLTLKQDVKDGNVTYTYGLKNQVVVGEKGTPGADGKPGKDGVDGSIGVNGKDGSAVAINGKDGSIGLNGKDGKNGLTIKGQDGKVGVDGKDGETRLVYVEKADPTKPGSSDKTHELATLDDGQKYAGDNYVAAKDNQAESNVIAKKANERLDIVGGAKGNLTEGNIGVNAKDGKLHVQLAEKVNLGDKGSVTIGDTVVNNNGITIKTVSLTNQGLNNGGNKITHVAEGKDDTDAVNVKQLKDFKSEVAEGGLTFAGNSGDAHKAKLNTTVNIKGGEGNTDADQFDNGKNVMTKVNGNTVTVSIKKTPEVEGINIIDTTGKVKVKLTQTDEGLKVSDGNNNATRITNVKAGEKDTDAVNVKQLNAAKTEVTAGDNIDVRSSTGANGQTIYKVSANDTSAAVEAGSDHVKVTKAANTHKDGSTTVTDYTVDLSDKTKEDIKKGVDAHTEVTTKGLTFNADKGSTGVKKLGSNVAVNGDGKNITTTADENGVKVSMKDDIKVNSVTAKEVKVGDVNINENGINAGGKRITNVAPGKDGTDAVNVNQLKYVAGNISNQINNVDKGLRAGIAGALASGGLYHVTTPGKSMVSVGGGTYRGQNALAVGYSRLSDNGKVGVKFTVNSNSQGHSGASASVGYQW